MKKYEYLNVTYHTGLALGHLRHGVYGPNDVTKFCNQYGEQGWEMVNFCFVPSNGLMCFMFKREKE